MTQQKGFTLIELIVVVIIVTILTSVALPSYQSYVMRGKIPDATSNLASKRVMMEQYFQDNHSYNPSGTVPPACNVDTTSSKYYTFTCPVLTATTYTIQATGGNGSDQSMTGFTYTIDQSNSKTSTVAAPAPSAWQSTQVQCWITTSGGKC